MLIIAIIDILHLSHRNKSCLKAQKSRRNQQKLCKVVSFFPPICFFQFTKVQFSNTTLFFLETLEKLNKKEEQCTTLTTESESLRSQMAGENI